MSYTPTSPGAATLHSVIDPNGGTLYKDVGATSAATTHGDVILSSKDGITSRIGLKIGGRDATLDVTGGVWSLRVTNAGIGSNTAGAGIQFTTGTMDPSASTILFCYKPDRRNKLVTDILLDVGNSPGTGLQVSQLVQGNGLLVGSSGAGLGTQSGGPYFAPSNNPAIFCFQSENGPIRILRHDHYDESGLVESSLNRTITSVPGATGYTVFGRNAANNWTQGNLYLLVAFSGVLTDGEVAAEMVAMKAYLEAEGIDFDHAGTAPKLIVSGDSNASGTGASRETTEWGALLHAGVVAAGVAGCTYHNLAAPTRQFTQMATIEQAVIDLANGTSGPVVYVCHCGENDLTVVTDETLLTRAQDHFTNIKAGAPDIRIIWLGIPARTDIAGGTLTAYDTNRSDLRSAMLADPTLGGLIEGYVDITGDGGLGATGASNSLTYFNGDKVHYNDAGQTRVFDGTDGSLDTLLDTVLPLFATDEVAPAVASAAVQPGGTTLVVTYAEADSPPILPAVLGADVTGYGVTAGGSPISVLVGRATGSLEHTLFLGEPIFAGQTVRLSYDAGTGNVEDSATPAGQALATFTDTVVTNGSMQTGGGAVFGGSGGLAPFGPFARRRR